MVLRGYGAGAVTLVINVTAAPTGTLPTLQYTIQEVDPGDDTTVFGSATSSSSITAAGIQTVTLSGVLGGDVKVSWVVGGSSPSFTGVYSTLGEGETSTGSIVSLQDAVGNPVDSVPATTNAAQIYKSQVTNTGSTDLRVNGAGTPVDFDVAADPTNDIWLSEVRFVLVVNPLLAEGGKFGPINALTNGVRIQVRSNGVTTDIGNVKITEDFLAFPSRGGTVVDRTGTNDVITVGYYLGGIIPLVAGSGDFLRVTIRDNLTSVKFKHFTCTVHGIKRP